jgi:hypothetical protein
MDDLNSLLSNHDQVPFQVQTIETGISRKWLRLISAVLVSLVGLWLMGVSVLTDLPRKWLPYTEDLAQIIVPKAIDGQEPIELIELSHNIDGTQIVVEGKIRNRTAQSLEDIVAIVNMGYTHLVDPVSTNIKLVPMKIEAGGEGYFKIAHALQGKLSGYSLTFKLENGAILRHRDGRNFSLPATTLPLQGGAGK